MPGGPARHGQIPGDPKKLDTYRIDLQHGHFEHEKLMLG